MKTEIEKHIGKLVRIDYTTKIGSKNSITGQISELNDLCIVFTLNDDKIKIKLVYEQITDIQILT